MSWSITSKSRSRRGRWRTASLFWFIWRRSTRWSGGVGWYWATRRSTRRKWIRRIRSCRIWTARRAQWSRRWCTTRGRRRWENRPPTSRKKRTYSRTSWRAIRKWTFQSANSTRTILVSSFCLLVRVELLHFHDFLSKIKKLFFFKVYYFFVSLHLYSRTCLLSLRVGLFTSIFLANLVSGLLHMYAYIDLCIYIC